MFTITIAGAVETQSLSGLEVFINIEPLLMGVSCGIHFCFLFTQCTHGGVPWHYIWLGMSANFSLSYVTHLDLTTCTSNTSLTNNPAIQRAQTTHHSRGRCQAKASQNWEGCIRKDSNAVGINLLKYLLQALPFPRRFIGLLQQ